MHPQTPTTFALRGDRFKFIQYHGIWDTDELYDLEADPNETTNLIRDPVYAAVGREMRDALDAELRARNAAHVPFGKKGGPGQTLRRRDGSPAAEFPDHVLRDVSRER